MGNRLEANRELVKRLQATVEMFPDWRFGQILFNGEFIVRRENSLEIKDPYYEESTETLKRVGKIIPSSNLLKLKTISRWGKFKIFINKIFRLK